MRKNGSGFIVHISLIIDPSSPTKALFSILKFSTLCFSSEMSPTFQFCIRLVTGQYENPLSFQFCPTSLQALCRSTIEKSLKRIRKPFLDESWISFKFLIAVFITWQGLNRF